MSESMTDLIGRPAMYERWQEFKEVVGKEDTQ